MNSFTQAPADVFFKRGDSNDPRLGELVQFKPPSSPSLGILGYPDDEGIRRNGGRAGAALGPHHIRRVLYKMTPAQKNLSFWDHGDLDLTGSLEDRHETAKRSAKELLNQGHRLLSFGGGHDYGYCDGWAFLEWAKSQKEKPLIINFDAHMDVRPLDRGITSGTPFFRLLNEFSGFDLVEIGIQSQCNSMNHIQWAKDRGVRILHFEDFLVSAKSLTEYVTEQIPDLIIKRRPTFLSVDIDAFSWPYAIGASQSWPLGIEPQQFFPLLQILTQRLDVKSLGIYEVSPPLEMDFGTSKLAALIAHRFLHV